MRLIDADEAYKVLTDNYHHRTEFQHEALKEAIERVPTIDAVEVVRCKDCKFFENEDEDGDCWCYCHNDITCRDGYCSWGERKDEVTDG